MTNEHSTLVGTESRRRRTCSVLRGRSATRDSSSCVTAAAAAAALVSLVMVVVVLAVALVTLEIALVFAPLA